MQNNVPYLNFGRARAPQEFPFLPELPDPFAADLASVPAWSSRAADFGTSRTAVAGCGTGCWSVPASGRLSWSEGAGAAGCHSASSMSLFLCSTQL